MKRTKDFNTNKGITLIALVITIIVMLILVGVTISMAVNGGLFEQAGKAASKTNEALKAEQLLADGGIKVGDTWYNSIDEYLNKDKDNNKVETISKETNYLGKYADVDGDGTADGIIYADLAFSRDEMWGEHNNSYEAVADVTELKDYYVSGTHDGPFGNGIEVLTATGEGKERFYVMALEDIDGQQYGTQYSWYASKEMEGIPVVASQEFGSGKNNTKNVIEYWNDDPTSSGDFWGAIQTQVNNGWFVPSTKEWVAFGECCVDELDDTHSDSIGLSDSYWSSSTYPETYGDACYVGMRYAEIGTSILASGHNVRLSIIF